LPICAEKLLAVMSLAQKSRGKRDTLARLSITIEQKKKGCEVEPARALVLKVEQK
jgi:hypothetical protein